MVYDERLLWRLVDKHLETYDTSMEKIRNEEAQQEEGRKGKKKAEPYYLRYPFESLEQNLKWQAWAKKEVGKFYKDWNEERLEKEWEFIDAMVAPSCMYLFKEIPKTLFN